METSPRRHRHLGVGADAAEVVDVAQRRHHRSELARPPDQPFHHLRPYPLAEPHAAVEHHHRARRRASRSTPVFGDAVSFVMLWT